jgi:hypothetical protein
MGICLIKDKDFYACSHPNPSSRPRSAAGLIGVQAANASATTFRGRINDPVERLSDKSHDITSVASTFDNGTGRWNVSVTFAAAPTAATSARLYLGLTVPRGQCPLGAGALGVLVETDSALSTYSQSCRQGTPQTIKRAISGNVLLRGHGPGVDRSYARRTRADAPERAHRLRLRSGDANVC